MSQSGKDQYDPKDLGEAMRAITKARGADAGARFLSRVFEVSIDADPAEEHALEDCGETANREIDEAAMYAALEQTFGRTRTFDRKGLEEA